MQLSKQSRSSSGAKLATLRRIPMLAGCRERELALVARCVDEASVKAGTVLTEEASPAREAFIIIDGWAAVSVHGEPVAALGPGRFVGEIAMIDKGRRSATVTAKTDMELLVVGPHAFADLASIPAVALGLQRELAERLRHTTALIAPDSE